MTAPARRPLAGLSWGEVRWAVLDVEGNGQPDPDLVEVAVVRVVDGAVQPARSWLVRPPRPVTRHARRIHGLSADDLAGAPTIEQVAPDLLANIVGTDVVVGHQVGVDLAALRRGIPAWPDLPALDTLRLARTLHPGAGSHRLEALAERFALTTGLPGPAHRAAYDATVTARLLIHLARADGGPTVDRLMDVGRPPPSARRLIANDDGTLFDVT